jgi:hypothetical protein
MYADVANPDEEVRVLVKVHDTNTNTNWVAEIYGTVAEIARLWHKSAKLMDDAGFVPGWRTSGTPCGSVQYLVLIREAVERCWRMSFNTAPNVIPHRGSRAKSQG